jgi:hypothetical protein
MDARRQLTGKLEDPTRIAKGTLDGIEEKARRYLEWRPATPSR